MLAAIPGWNEIPGALVVYDPNGQVGEANEAALEILGVTRRQLVGSFAEDSDWLVLESADGPMAAHPVTAALKSRRAVRGVLARVRRPDGADIWLQVDAVPQLSGAGEVNRVVATMADVTHLFAKSRLTSRGAGDHIVSQIVDELADVNLETRAILIAVTNALSRMRPATWVAELLDKDPSTSQTVAANSERPEFAEYINRFGAQLDPPGHAPTTGVSQRVIESGKPLLLKEAPTARLLELGGPEIQAYAAEHPLPVAVETADLLAVPMRARGGIVGTLSLYELPSSNPLTEKDTVWMQAVADRTALAIENAQLFEDAVRRLERLSSLQSLSLALSASPDLRLTLKVILDQVAAQLRVDAADVLLLDETDNMLTLAASAGFLATAVPDYRLPVDEGLPGRSIAGRRIETVTALSAFSQFRRRSLFAREGFKAYGAVPLITRGKLLGALEVYHRSPLAPDQEWLSFLDALGSVAAIAIDNAAMQDRLRKAQVAGPLRRVPAAPRDISRLELQIVRLAVEGRTNREIAAEVHLSQNTIKFHMRQLFQKTRTSNRTELAHQVAKEGWL
jgi:PAS domain S-box-containing protein